MRRLLLPAIVMLALGFASVAALTSPAPHRLPATALGAVVVWRIEVAIVVFAALYGVVIVARLALHGETLTRVGRDGIEIPRVGSARFAEAKSGCSESSKGSNKTPEARKIRRPTYELLRHREEAA